MGDIRRLTLTLFSKRKWIFPERVKVGGEEIHAGVYLFVQSPPEEEDPRFPWIAKVTNVRPGGNQLDILWAHHPHTLPMTCKKYRGPWEIIMSRDFHDLIDIESVAGRAGVLEHCKDCRAENFVLERGA